jgi:ABC-type transporter Mla subunit MlaD
MAESSRSAGDGPATEPEQIEAEIAQTREDLGDTVAALAEKADVKAHAKQKVDETRAAAKQKVEERRAAAQQKANETAAAARRTIQTAPERATQAQDRVRTAASENPAAAVAAASAGALVVLLLLRARRR